jgi:hypothetical protein
MTAAPENHVHNYGEPSDRAADCPVPGCWWNSPRPAAILAGIKETAETIHQCPLEGEYLMPCCGLTPFEVPCTDRMTLNPDLATCHAVSLGSDSANDRGACAPSGRCWCGAVHPAGWRHASGAACAYPAATREE